MPRIAELVKAQNVKPSAFKAIPRKEVVGRQMNFSSDAIADFAGLLEVSQEICMQQMAEKASSDVLPICAVLP